MSTVSSPISIDPLPEPAAPTDKVRRVPIAAGTASPPGAKERRAPAPAAVTQAPGRGYLPMSTVLFLVLLALVVGVWTGGLLQSRRQKASEVIASVNGATIGEKDFLHRMEILNGAQVMQQLLQERLQLQFAAAQKAVPTEQEIDAKLRALRKQPDYKEMQRRGLPDSDIRNQLKINMIQQRLAIRNLPIAESDILAFYQANIDPHNPKSAFYHPESIVVQVIETQTQEQAISAVNELNSQVEWATVVDHSSIHPSRANHGKLEPIYHLSGIKGPMGQFQDILFKMQPEERLPVQRIGSTWWVIQCLDRKPPVVDPYAMVRDDCRIAAAQSRKYRSQFLKQQQQTEKEFAAFRAKSNIQPFWERYHNLIQVLQGKA